MKAPRWRVIKDGEYCEYDGRDPKHVEVEGDVKPVSAGYNGIGMETRSATIRLIQKMDVALKEKGKSIARGERGDRQERRVWV